MKQILTLELVEIALKNFAGQPIDDNLIPKIKEELDRLRTREDFVPPVEGGTVADICGEAEKEAAAEEGPADEQLEGDDKPAAPDAADPEPAPEPAEAPQGEPEDTGAVRKPRQKMQKIIVAYDPDHKVPTGTEILGYPIEIPADDPPDGRTFDRRVADAVEYHNGTKRGRKHPVENLRQALETIYDDIRSFGVRPMTETGVMILFRGAELPQPAVPAANPAQPPA
jgi:hypothetical protein